LRGVDSHYVYILRRPDGRPFYVGKGIGPRVFAHENEARHLNGHRSNAHKLNVIRSIWRAGEVLYEIDFVSTDEALAFERETQLIERLRRLHEGGPLTNRAAGGGSVLGPAPVSKARHKTTLGGIPEDNEERAILNRFVLAVSPMASVAIKPASQFRCRPTKPYPSKTIGVSLRQAVALAASASANGIMIGGACEVPRQLVVEGVAGLVENGVSCDIVTSGLGALVPHANPVLERFALRADQARRIVGLVGHRKCADLGIVE